MSDSAINGLAPERWHLEPVCRSEKIYRFTTVISDEDWFTGTGTCVSFFRWNAIPT